MSDGCEFQVCGAATENVRRANSGHVPAADSSGTSEDRRGRTGIAVTSKGGSEVPVVLKRVNSTAAGMPE